MGKIRGVIMGVLIVVLLIFTVACGGKTTSTQAPAQSTTPTPAPATTALPSDGVQSKGEKLFVEKTCSTCHMINGKGGLPGNKLNEVEIPDLGQVGTRLTKEQIVKQILDPKGVKPDGQMVPLGISNEDAQALADYLLTLK